MRYERPIALSSGDRQNEVTQENRLIASMTDDRVIEAMESESMVSESMESESIES